jgi:endoglucanase
MEKQSFSDGLFSPLGIKRVIFMLVLLTTSFISCSNSDEKGGSLEVAQEYRNLEFDARGSRQTIQIDGPNGISVLRKVGVKVHILSVKENNM